MSTLNDDFADLFKAAKPKSSVVKQCDLSSAQQNPLSKVDDWAIFEKPKQNSDSLIDIFDSFDLDNQARPSTQSSTPDVLGAEKNAPAKSAKSNNDLLLLDDDFTDAFSNDMIPPSGNTIRKPAQHEKAQQMPIKHSTKAGRQARPNSPPQNRIGEDEIFAQLIDMGFSDKEAGVAMERNGPHLQRCVNYLMSRKRLEGKPQEKDFGKIFTDMSTDFLGKASSFINKSKVTVMKNMEQFGLTEENTDDGRPAWMKDQHKYKKDAIERKDGKVYEDYGSDDQNINNDAIREFMRSQKQRRSSPRHHTRGLEEDLPKSGSSMHSKNSNRIEVNIGKSSVGKPSGLSRDPRKESVPQQHKHEIEQPVAKPVSAFNRSTNAMLVNAPRSTVVEEDLLGFSAPAQVAPSKTTRSALNEFSQSSYEVSKTKASEMFKNGDYDGALEEYMKCIEVLPDLHELRVVILSNLALVYTKSGNHKRAIESSTQGMALIDLEEVSNTKINIEGKTLKSWYVKFLTRKAEAYEVLEQYSESLIAYNELVKLGATDRKIIDSRRRVNNIVNPPKRMAPVVTKKQEAKPKPAVSKELKKYREEEAQREQIIESINEKVAQWAKGNEANMRALLTALPDIIPERFGFWFVTKRLSLNDLMLPKKVKINYMKVISTIHPDKVTKLQLEDRLLCEGVFVALNKAWEVFKEEV